MTTATPSATPHLSRLHYLPLAVGASVVHMLMMIPGYNEDGFQTGDWLFVFAISLVVSIAVFTFAVPGAGTTTGIVLGVLAVASVLVFWLGITLPLAAAAGMVGWTARQRGSKANATLATLILAAVSVVALVAIIIGDAIAN